MEGKAPKELSVCNGIPTTDRWHFIFWLLRNHLDSLKTEMVFFNPLPSQVHHRWRILCLFPTIPQIQTNIALFSVPSGTWSYNHPGPQTGQGLLDVYDDIMTSLGDLLVKICFPHDDNPSVSRVSLLFSPSIPNTRSAIAHRIYVWYIYLTFTIKINQNVGNYTVRPIDPMGFLPILNSGYQRWCSCLESVAWDQLCTLLSFFFGGRFQINHIRALWWPRPRVYFVKGKVRTQKMASTKAWNLAWWMTCR